MPKASTHLIDSERLSKSLALLSLALCWTFLVGEWLHQLKPLLLKKHGRRAKSLFRYGFDYLRNIILNLEQKLLEFLDVLGRVLKPKAKEELQQW